MPSLLLKFLQDVRASYWFIPSIALALALVLATVTHQLDLRVSDGMIDDLPFFDMTFPEGARAILTTVAGSIIGVAGVTFSITIATVSFASGNYGPRLIGNFMRDRGNQVVLGVFIGTFVYSLLALRSVQSPGEGIAGFVPHVSLTTAMALALTSIGFLIYFFHHVPESIDVQHLTARVGSGLRQQIFDLFPNDYDGEEDEDDLPWRQGVSGRARVRIISGKNGYVRTFAVSQAERICRDHDLYLDMQYRPGDFVTEDDIVLDVFLAEGERLDEDLADKLRELFATGGQRNPEQNVLFRVDTLVEIAGRALSPGVNDPQTAISAFNWLRSAVNAFADRKQEERKGTDGDPFRVRTSPLTFEVFTYHAFTRPRPYVAADRNASFHVLHVLAECAVRQRGSPRQAILIRQIEDLVAEARALNPEANWTKSLMARRDDAVRLIESPDHEEARRTAASWFGGRG